MKNLYKTGVFPLLLCLSACNASKINSSAAPAPVNSLLWKISGKGIGKPSYVFGTFHIMCKDDIHFSQALRDALGASDKLYFEMDLDDPSNTFGGMMYMNMKDGKTLKDLYSPTDYSTLVNFFKDSLNLSLESLKSLKPMMLQAILYTKFFPCKNQTGVEMELMTLAKKLNKEIRGFEDVKFQSAIFDRIPYEEQAKELRKIPDSLQQQKAEFNEIVQAYLAQDLNKINQLMNKAESLPADQLDLLVYNRNENWIGQLNDLLPANGLFIAVGAGHLPGSKGLLELLRKQGYTVEPVMNK